MVHAFDIFQMLDVLQDLRGTVAHQVSLLFCPFLVYPAHQMLSVYGQVSYHRQCLEIQIWNLVTPAVLLIPRMGFLGRDS